jgi:hypothetical protein
VLHRHPNQGNILTLRNPAPADVADTALRAFQAEKPITEIVEHDLPDGTRGRTRYTVQPNHPFEVHVEFLKPDGTVESRAYPSLQEYARAYGERTLYLDPADPLYKWVMADLGVVQAQGAGGPRVTAMGVARGTAPGSERAVRRLTWQDLAHVEQLEMSETGARVPKKVKLDPAGPKMEPQAGGHTLEKHIYMTDADLEARALQMWQSKLDQAAAATAQGAAPVQPDPTAATRFVDPDAAVLAVNDVLAKRRGEVEKFLRDAPFGDEAIMAFEADLKRPVGTGFVVDPPSGTAIRIEGLTKVTVVLKWNGVGWVVRTAFPIP